MARNKVCFVANSNTFIAISLRKHLTFDDKFGCNQITDD